eukprot:GFUD01003650.1.p1 GENE.GFUD01003650.1~~GFUD01003650.1.p1  ORF type:complete len:432 (-),score=95.64 GFUD01003650.1:147-1376(-)
MWTDIMEDIALGMFKEKKLETLLKSDNKVDAVITLSPSGTFFADHFDCPVIIFSPTGPVSFLMAGTGNMINPSVQPSIIAPFIEPMSFGKRIQNHFLTAVFDAWIAWFYRGIAEIQRKSLGQEIRNPYDIMKERFSIYLGCSHFTTHGSWPYLPNVIEVGGLHLKDAKLLPADLQSFMDSSPNGVVFVSFGSSLKPDQMPKDKLDIFVETFRSLDMSVIWKWDAEVPNLPKNVKISSWLPQQDLLGHPNLKVFVTHGGLGSLVEAIYHKAVIVGIPFSNDQKPNLLRATRHGYATSLDWENLSAEDLTKGIKEAMVDENMKSSMDRIHSLYVDREEKPVDKAAWWVEYVCRHKGAEMLKSGAEDIPWYQFHHVDIFVFIAGIFSCVLGGMVLSCKLCCRFCCAKKTKTD